LPVDARLAASLVALQTIGITTYLPQHGVGGAFFGAYVSQVGVRWQPDLMYLTYPPNLFDNTPIVRDGDDLAAVPETRAVEKVRVVVRDGAGIVLSSLADPPGRILLPPTDTRPVEEWEQMVRRQVPEPFRLLVPSRHIGLLSRAHAKPAYVYNPRLRDDENTAFAVRTVGRRTHVFAPTRMVETLQLAPPDGRFDLTVITHDDVGADAKTYGITIPTE
jgi:hypothetical protein